MFWGSFSGNRKGPAIFWEKDWGTISSETYIAHTVPMIHGWIRMNPHLLFMQDNASSHSSAQTTQELRERGVNLIFWPAYSPDLNPIETLWNKMKDWIARNYPGKKATYDQLRRQVREA